jgi:HEAT repeat protein
MADKRRRADDDDDDLGLRTPSKKPATKKTERPEKAEKAEKADPAPRAKGDTGRRDRPSASGAAPSDDGWRKVEPAPAGVAPKKGDTGKRPALPAPSTPRGAGSGKTVMVAAGLGLVLAVGGAVALLAGGPVQPVQIGKGSPAGETPIAIAEATESRPVATPGIPRPQVAVPVGPAATQPTATEVVPAPVTPTAAPPATLEELARRSANHGAVARLLEQYNELFRFDVLTQADPTLADFQSREQKERELLAQIHALGGAVVPALLDMLKGVDQRAHQIFLAKALAGMEGSEAVSAVEQALASVKDVSVQTTLVRHLPDTPEAASAVGRAVRGEENPNLRGMLMREYSRRSPATDEEGRAIFRQMALEDPDPNVRQEAITLIGHRGDERDADLLEQMARNEPQLPIRQRALVALSETAKGRSLPLLENLARDATQTLPVRASAVLGLGRVATLERGRPAGDDAIRALDQIGQSDPDQEIRTRATRLAANLRTAAAAERDTPVNQDPVQIIPGGPTGADTMTPR